MSEEPKIVVPGDRLGASEEYLPGPGTYEQNGNLYAATVGVVEVDPRERLLKVRPTINAPPIPRTGDIVVGRISDIKNSMCFVEIALIQGKGNRPAAVTEEGAIHISSVKNSYVRALEDEFGYLDLVKAQVVDGKTLRLSTIDRNLGVIRTLCPACKVVMTKKNPTDVECPQCRRVETRKLSEDYGEGAL
ncbi:MAG: exosome complex RNA-binding protein Csl4 [Euryarchaeota archaeon]|nr:exosome complex RNA-binding protein Csl4 [Euryarchaeota archaeon]